MRRRKQRASGVADVGEFGLIARFLHQLPVSSGVVVGPGHDCAVVAAGPGSRFLFTVDALVEGRHFKRGWLSPREIGRKSFLVNASDVAAMGGKPRFCVVSLGLPGDYPARAAVALQRGIAGAARECGASVVGGNLTRSPFLFVSVALIAEGPRRLVTRGGARPGDRIFVTGTLGDAALGRRFLDGASPPGSSAYPVRRFRQPSPRLREGQWLAGAGIASAAIDVSDGLLQDLGHLCASSGVGAVVHAECVPRSRSLVRHLGKTDALPFHGGEDYEILCTVPGRQLPRLERSRGRLACPLTEIGEIVPGRTVRLLRHDGTRIELTERGHDHFRSGSRRNGERRERDGRTARARVGRRRE